MTYVSPNFKTKKAFKEAVTAGKTVNFFEPGIGSVPQDGKITVEGPHYPEPHKWYASVTLVAGKAVKIT